ncbi:MAG: hypothetical protein AB1765_11075 [Candidatus Hydrogenedentota bacterium]
MFKKNLAILMLLFLFSNPLFARRPLRVDDSDIASYRKSELETGLEYHLYSRRAGNIESIFVPLKYSYGLTREWEAAVTVPFVDYRSGLKMLSSVSFHTKYVLPFFRNTRNQKTALEFIVYLPSFSTRGFSQWEDVLKTGMNLSFTQDYARFKLYENIGYTIVSKSESMNTKNVVNAGLGMEKKLNSFLFLVSELEARSSNLPGRDDSLANIFLGFKYCSSSNFIVDFGIGVGMGKGSSDFRGSTGITYLF